MTHAPAPPDSPAIDLGGVLKRVGLFVLLVALVVVALSALPGIGEVRERFAAMEWHWLALAGVCELLSMIGFVVALYGAFDRIPPPVIAAELGFAEQGTNVLLPAGGAGGPAFGALVMRRAGVPDDVATERHAVLFLLTSGASFGGLLVFGVLTATGALHRGDVGLVGTIVPAAVAVAVIGVAVLFSRMGAPAPPAPKGGPARLLWRVRRFVHNGVRLSLAQLRHGDPLLLLGSIAFYAFDIAALGFAFQALGGGGPPFGVFVLAYTVGHAGALLPTPGGVGGTDGGLIGAFVLYGSALAPATAAVLAYRVFQLGLPVLLGGVSLLRIRHHLQHGPPPEVVAANYRQASQEREALRR